MEDLTAKDLAVFLNEDEGELDTERAEALIGLAVQLCESIISPLPEGARPVVIGVVQRAYLNPGLVSQESIGPFSGSLTAGGVYLTTKEERTLKRLRSNNSGGGGAFSIDMLPDDVLIPAYPQRLVWGTETW